MTLGATTHHQAEIERLINLLEQQAESKLAQSVQHLKLAVERHTGELIGRERSARAEATATRLEADKAIRELAESEQRYRYMGETIPFGVWWCNPKGEAEYVSPSFCELLNMTLQEQRAFGWTQRLVPEDREPMMTKWMHCCATGTPWEHEHRIIDRYGKIHTVLSRGLPVRDQSGQIIAWVGVNLDITQRKAMEVELQQAKEALEEALRVKDQFMANISHELRTPLTLILGPVRKRLAGGNLTDEERRELEMVERNARTLLKHVNDLLDLSKLEVGEVQADYAQTDLAQAARLVASYFEVLAEERQIQYAVEIPESLPAEVDAEKVQRVLLNLLSNAFKFTPEGGSVRFSLRAEDQMAVFAVKDTGPGIPPHLREAIFERFRQAEESSTRRHGGTGLGLSIVREFVNLHRGSVAVEDAPGGGSRFVVRIPLAAPQGVDVRPVAAEVDEETARQATEELRTHAGVAARSVPAVSSDAPLVLVVEDNPEMNAFVAGMLARSHRVVSAFDGREGLEQALAVRPDLIISDIMMPQMSGEELVCAIRQHTELDGIPILLLTAKADDELRVRLLKEGAQDYLNKPFSADELLARAEGLITQKRRSEQSIRESYRLLRAVTEGITDAVFVKDKQGRYLLINTPGAHMLGRPVEEVVGKGDRQFFAPEEAERIAEIDRAVMTEGQTRTYEEAVTTGGIKRILLTTKGPYRDDQGNIIGLLGITRDITQRKQAEEELRQAKEVAEEASEAKDHFLAVLSHELRTPLTPVLMSTSVLQRDRTLPQEVQEDIEVIRRNVEMEARLIDDLLDLTRITRGKVHLHYEVVDVHATLRNALDIVQNEIEEKELAVSFSLRARQHRVWGDAGRIQQVFWNVVKNAVKFTPEGGRIDIRTTNDEQGRLRIQIKDTGIGIEPEALPRIFNAFEQAEKTRTRRFGGLGLGLTISKMLVDMHKGSITAHSEGKDRGAIFTVEFGTIPAEVEQPAPSAIAGMRLVSTSSGSKLRILLVEDHPDTRRMIANQLRQFGYNVHTAGSVHEALELAGQDRFDLLISDIGLPDGTGLDIMQQVKSRYGLRGIALSGFGMDEDVLKSKAAGFEHHLTKPVDFQTLQAVIQRTAS